MKKLIALITLLATVLSLSACKLNKDLSPEEKMSKYAAEESKKVAESLQAENDYIDGVNEYSKNEIGKTIKGKKLVIKVGNPLGYEYDVYLFDKKGKATEFLSYEFFDSIENFEVQSEMKTFLKKKIVNTDKEARLIIYKHLETPVETFDELYHAFSSDFAKDHGYTLIE